MDKLDKLYFFFLQRDFLSEDQRGYKIRMEAAFAEKSYSTYILQKDVRYFYGKRVSKEQMGQMKKTAFGWSVILPDADLERAKHIFKAALLHEIRDLKRETREFERMLDAVHKCSFPEFPESAEPVLVPREPDMEQG